MRKLVSILFVIIILGCLIVPITVSSHSGRTDANGGHYDNINGGYHYHHGLPAHEHPNGRCPFDYDEAPTKESPVGIIVAIVVVIAFFTLGLLTKGKSVDLFWKVFFYIFLLPFRLIGCIITGICWLYDKVKQNND